VTHSTGPSAVTGWTGARKGAALDATLGAATLAIAERGWGRSLTCACRVRVEQLLPKGVRAVGKGRNAAAVVVVVVVMVVVVVTAEAEEMCRLRMGTGEQKAIPPILVAVIYRSRGVGESAPAAQARSGQGLPLSTAHTGGAVREGRGTAYNGGGKRRPVVRSPPTPSATVWPRPCRTHAAVPVGRVLPRGSGEMRAMAELHARRRGDDVVPTPMPARRRPASTLRWRRRHSAAADEKRVNNGGATGGQTTNHVAATE